MLCVRSPKFFLLGSVIFNKVVDLGFFSPVIFSFLEFLGLVNRNTVKVRFVLMAFVKERSDIGALKRALQIQSLSVDPESGEGPQP